MDRRTDVVPDVRVQQGQGAQPAADHVVAPKLEAGAATETLPVGDAEIGDRMGLDIGPVTVSAYTHALTDALLAERYGRDAAVIAVGGGVTGDLAGFVAATYLRGVPWVNVPTSLVAMVDASVGGKTGVDAPSGKNLVGAFHQPRLVVADIDTLRTLPGAAFAGGLAEAVKHGVIADAAYFALLSEHAPAILDCDGALLEQVVARSVAIKAAVVAADPLEAGRRSILNYGHTVGHAIEAVSGLRMAHGAAVAIGMVIEARLGERLGHTAAGTATAVASALQRFRLPVDVPRELAADALVETMRVDKKGRGGALRFALPARVGAMTGDEQQGWTVVAPEELVRETLLEHNP